ncbi:AsmA-like C-terminal region-containing protein [Defluviimonas sp. WL0050]|uniref:AsmA-like C-terminal region-containing protein n=2 Tax=Albidovulum litorale TaxID=2984134 RepID=A0ABT2ZIW5_9RHOB|nr:AsmA-like C-terminal region-containing protein [Defluviimonas sp. WL0050]
MNQTESQAGKSPDPGPFRRRRWLWALLGLTMSLVSMTFVALSMTGRVVAAPGWLVAQVETRANAVLAGEASAKLGGLDLMVDENLIPHVWLRRVELFSKTGTRIALLPDLRTTLNARPMLDGKIELRSLHISDGRIALRRLEDGRLDLALGPGAAAPAEAVKPAELLKVVDAAFELPLLRDVERIEVDRLSMQLDDLRTGRVWRASGGWLTLTNSAEAVEIGLGTALADTGKPPARAEVTFRSVKGTPEAALSVRLSDVPSRDLAVQSPALSFLGALDAPISGAFDTGVDAEGRYSGLSAVLEIGKGALRPTADTKPVRFDRVKLAMSYDPEAALMTFSDLDVDSTALRVRASAKAWLKDFKGAWPETLVSQVRIEDFKADPEGVFTDAVTLSGGALDFRLRLDPFRLELGQMMLTDGDQRIGAKGTIAAAPAGWDVAVDVTVNEITSDRLLALWPVAAVPLTRAWLEQNVATSQLFDVVSAFRLRPGQEPHFTLGYDYRDTEVRIIKTLPPIQNGAGYATINDYSYTLVVDRGHVTAPEGGDIDVSGSVMAIPDLRIKPAPAKFTLKTDSSITAALSLLDQPPFEFLTKAGRPVDLAEGRARLETALDLRLARKIMPEDVDYRVTGKLLDVRSDTLAPDRLLTAAALDVTATREGLEISGPAIFSGVPVDAAWRQVFSPEHRGKSELQGIVELSPRFLEAFSIGLPPGAVRGTGQGRIVLRFERGKPVEFRLGSNLKGLNLSIPEVGWAKGAGGTGRLSVVGRLGQPAEIDLVEIEAPGLTASGRVVLTAKGALEAVRLKSVRIGDWFNGTATLRGRGQGLPVAVIVEGGSVDLRRASFGSGGGQGAPLSVALDRLQVSEGISLTGFRGDFSTQGGLTGEFIGTVNGEAPVTGRVTPSGTRSAVHLRAADAGAAMRAAGIFTRGVGGALDMTLTPVGEPGTYDGQIQIGDLRVVDAPALASLLDAVSVVGLLSQLNGPGILFSRVTGDFRLTPGIVQIRKGTATGPSLGISADGLYDTGAGRIDLQGTVSPVYLINQIGQVVSREGEGLFGFNYRLYGAADAPKVSVNPLSILTPGMFRNIFRANPPKQQQ